MSMREAGGSGKRETENQRVLVQMNGLSEDLLQRVIAGNHFPGKFEEAAAGEESGGIELSLGLSLNGRFGVDPKKAKMLTRSSSISDFMTPLRCQERASSTVAPITALTRTCSLPMETEEEWRKRKELQTLRRMEAKRKRTAKQRSHKAARSRDRDRASFEENCEEDKVVEDRPPVGRNGNCMQQQQSYLGMPSWNRGGFIPCKTDRVNGIDGGDGVLEGHTATPPPPPPPPPPLAPPSQGLSGSQKSSSSGISELENQSVQVPGVNQCSEERSPASTWSLPDQNEQKPLISPGTPEKLGNVGQVVAENQPKKPPISNEGLDEMARKVMEDMPCVSTTGDGPDGKKVDGFLYRYKKGEEVRIVCVCHGSFLSPAEFVKHAGGSDVDHPLRHIVVYPSLL